MNDQDTELWAVIKEFPTYEISNRGHIHNTRDGRIMQCSKTMTGHGKITLSSEVDKQRYTRSVARLVAEAFVEPPNPSCDSVILLDGDFFNVAAYNLAWRPNWFAWKYTRQLKTNPPLQYQNLPVLNTTTQAKYNCIVDAAMAEGLLFEDIWRSTYTGDRIFPNGSSFEIVRQRV